MKPRFGFWKGLLAGAAIEVPAFAFAVWLLGFTGIGAVHVGFLPIVRLTAELAGIAALLTAGGVGRLAADASVEGGRHRAVFVAARAHAVAGMGLMLVATIPHGNLPDRGPLWAVILLVGIIPGAFCGALIGSICGGSTSIDLGDVLVLARVPTSALRSWLGSEQLAKLGAAVRERTTHWFDGMFEPGPPPPPTQDDVAEILKGTEADPRHEDKP
ncbi:MAG TPA: hypothetical protein VGM88_15730 [Kofleriaceae bacterium]